MKDIHFQQNGVAADYNAVVSRPYRKVPTNTESKLVPALSGNE